AACSERHARTRIVGEEVEGMIASRPEPSTIRADVGSYLRCPIGVNKSIAWKERAGLDQQREGRGRRADGDPAFHDEIVLTRVRKGVAVRDEHAAGFEARSRGGLHAVEKLKVAVQLAWPGAGVDPGVAARIERHAVGKRRRADDL